MGDYIRVPVTELETIGRELESVRVRMEAEQNKKRLIIGLDKHGEKVIPLAEGTFFDEWKTSIEKLLEGIGTLGELSTAIAAGAEGIDTAVAGQADGISATLDGFDFHLGVGADNG